MGLQTGTWDTRIGQEPLGGARSHRASPQPPLFPLEKLSPSHPLQRHTQAHAVTLLQNQAISWKVGLDHSSPALPSLREELLPSCGSAAGSGTFPGKNCCIFQEKSLRVEPGSLGAPEKWWISLLSQSGFWEVNCGPRGRKTDGFQGHERERLRKTFASFFFKERS